MKNAGAAFPRYTGVFHINTDGLPGLIHRNISIRAYRVEILDTYFIDKFRIVDVQVFS